MKNLYRELSPNRLVALWLVVWWICNLLQASFSELANDEAYYHIFAQGLEWGYFDHPPAIALLVWMGEQLFGGELGVRFFVTLLQPLYLWIFWRLIRPAGASREDATLYIILSAATLLLQLYGFIAVPDGALLFSSALFFVAFHLFAQRRAYSWLWMGVAMALMAYSKYHGALVVIFALGANPRLLLRRELYFAGVVTLLLLIPHLLWQWQHDWASFEYHLSSRNSIFRFNYVTEFLLNMLIVFNPLFVPIYIKAWSRVRVEGALARALKWMPPAFIAFFLLSSFRGYVQPQWAIVALFGWLYTLLYYVREHPRTRRYIVRAGSVTIALVVVVRMVMIFNPIDLRFEVFNNRTSNAQITSVAEGRTVIFAKSYTAAAKYQFYTGGDSYCQPNIGYRTHQWQFRDDDTHAIDREVVVELAAGVTHPSEQSIMLENGRSFRYFIDPLFRPTRKVEIESTTPLKESGHVGERIEASLTFHNPYPYDIRVGEQLSLVAILKYGRSEVAEFPIEDHFTIPCEGEIVRNVEFELSYDLPQREYRVGFALRREGYVHWFNSRQDKIYVRNKSN